MTPEIERLAKILWERFATEGGFDDPQNADDRASYCDAVRAILEAIREPSEGMYRAGAAAVPNLASKTDPIGQIPAQVVDYLSPAFRAMIDYILGK